MSNTDANFEDIKQRLDQIVDRVSEDDIDLDEALSLYEEAVKLGMAACDASEFDIEDAESVDASIDQPSEQSATSAELPPDSASQAEEQKSEETGDSVSKNEESDQMTGEL